MISWWFTFALATVTTLVAVPVCWVGWRLMGHILVIPVMALLAAGWLSLFISWG